jgi:hypothetical protein
MGTCSRRLLAETPQCRIERCGCGVLHLTIGPMTFRTTPDVLAALAHAASDANATLAAERLFGIAGWDAGRGAS